MKFLCVECDEAMKIRETKGPQDGSMTVIFHCSACGKDIAMLTNAMETQLVKSLDVKIGSKPAAVEPMGVVKNFLSQRREDILSDTPPQQPKQSGSGCPFSGVVEDAFQAQEAPITWTEEAETRLNRIPVFVRPMVKKSIEQQALEKGCREIDVSLLEEIKHKLGM